MKNSIAIFILLLLTAASRAEEGVSARIVWIEGKPAVEVAVDSSAAAPEGLKEVAAVVNLFDAKNTRLSQGAMTIPVTAEQPWRATVAIDKIQEPTKQHRLEVELRSAELKLDFAARLWFAAETAVVQSHGVASEGLFPKRKVYFTVGLNGFKGQNLKEIPAALVIRDADDAAVLNREKLLQPAAEPTQHRIDITPDPAGGVGPFTLEATLESDAYSLFFSATQRFAQPNALLPVSSLEHGDRDFWFAHSAVAPKDGWLEMYYSEHLRDLVPQNYPLVSYDRAEHHGGQQSLKIEYDSAREARVWSLQELPGKAVNLHLWVKGNGSTDQLVVHYHDRMNFTLPAWFRNANFDSAVITKLDFTGWREFIVPVQGRGLQASGTKGSTPEIDGPVRILALSIKPEKPLRGVTTGEPRTVWIDDLAVETQLVPKDLLTMELAASQPDGSLARDGSLSVSLGNGHAVDLKKGKLTLSARDADGKPVYTQSLDLPAAAQSFAQIDVPLADLAARNAPGPIELDVTYAEPTVPGARTTKRFTFKNPKQAGLFLDFEQPALYSGYQPGKVTPSRAAVVDGGAEGSARSLAIEVKPKEPDNSVLFHPALPGEVDHVELMVKGGAHPVVLQPWFIDSGATGVWLRNYNLFWARPITVDWQDWRKVTIAAPPIPPHHGEKNRAFLYQPWYPLNLAFNVTLADGETPVELRFDNVRVVTHLPAAEQLQVEVEYPDETRIHPPGSPLSITVVSYGSAAGKWPLEFELRNYQGFVAERGKQEVSLTAGAKQRLTLAKSLKPGIYDVVVRLSEKETRAAIMALDAKEYFGADPLAMLSDPLALRRELGLMTEKLYLDWDNTEPAPYLHHFNWFEQDLKKRKDVPVLPPALSAVASKNADAVAALAAADKAMKDAQAQLNPTAQAVKAAEAKAANSLKAIDAPKAAAQAAVTALEAATKKNDDAQKAAAVELEKSTAATKAADALDADAKKAKDAATAAAKLLADADKAAKDAEAALKPLDMAAVAAEKELQAAEMAATKAEADAKAAEAAAKAAEQGDNKDDAAKKATERDAKAEFATDARAKATDARKKFDAAKLKADDARKQLETKRTSAATVKTAADTAKAAADALPPKAQAARTAAQAAMKQSQAATMAASSAKNELAKAQQASQAAAKKLTDAEAAQAADRQALVDKQQAAAAAIAALEKSAMDVKSARAASATAAAALEEAKTPYALRVMPVVGFSADWAGPEASEALRKSTYQRWIPNMLQVPERLVDWSLFVRAVQREYKGRFANWVFWENPDLEQAPQSIPPERYRELLEIFHRWVKLYNPKARVIAGGFNFDKVIEYLSRIPDPDKLPLDEIAVQVNLGELSPEAADLEGFLDDLNDLLKSRATGRVISITELDWGIGPYVGALEQAAYHSRAALALHSRDASPHQFSLINTGFAFEGYGVFYRVSYGNTADLQTYKPYYVPKPSYFSLIATQKFLRDWKFVKSATLSGKSLSDNRAFIYQNAAGELTTVLWRAVEGARLFKLPAAWSAAAARDVFGFGMNLTAGLNCTPLPTFVKLPAGYKLPQLVEDLRMLEAADGSYPVVLDLHLDEPELLAKADYQATGSAKPVVHSGIVPGGEKVRDSYVTGLESETFKFTAKAAGNMLLRRRWHFEPGGEQLTVQLNDGSPKAWNLGDGQDNTPGVRESTFVLRNCRAGANQVTIRYSSPGNAAGYRIEPTPADHVPLVRWGAINTRQTKGHYLTHTSAVGTPLTIGKTGYESGLGAHAVSFIEYPLDGEFEKFEVTIGIDGSTEGRGSVVFRVFVDGKPVADSGVVNGFAKPQTLKVEKLAGAKRMILSVQDAGDGDRHDLANWVDGKLYLKKE